MASPHMQSAAHSEYALYSLHVHLNPTPPLVFGNFCRQAHVMASPHMQSAVHSAHAPYSLRVHLDPTLPLVFGNFHHLRPPPLLRAPTLAHTRPRTRPRSLGRKG